MSASFFYHVRRAWRFMLTAKQERFVQGIVRGKSQREAYRDAYPNSIKWKDSSVDNKACLLMKNAKVLERYNELTKPEEDETKKMRAFIIENLQKIASGEICDETIIYDKNKSVVQRKKTIKASDIANALTKLGAYYGVEEDQKETVNVILSKSEGYDA